MIDDVDHITLLLAEEYCPSVKPTACQLSTRHALRVP